MVISSMEGSWKEAVWKGRCILMFGFGKSNSQDVRLTEKEIKELKKNMSRSELKEFEKRQKRAEADRDWNLFMMADFLDDDDI